MHTSGTHSARHRQSPTCWTNWLSTLLPPMNRLAPTAAMPTKLGNGSTIKFARGWRTRSIVRRRARRSPAVSPPPENGRRVSSVMQDLRYAIRLLRRQPGYSAVIVGTMALGIAAVAILTSVTYGVLLKPLPWADAPRLVRLYETRQGSTGRFQSIMTNGTYLAWRESMTTLDASAAWYTEKLTLTGADDPIRVRIGQITPSMMPLLGAAPLAGRVFAGR